MSETPFFSVIIVNYNGGAYLQKAIDSLSGQTFQDFETWIVDNDSTDGSMERLDLSKAQNTHVVMVGRNSGFAEGNNIAARMAKGEWLVLLNADAAADDNWLETIRGATLENPDTSIFASTQLRMDDPSVMDGAGDGYTAYGFAWRGGFLQPDVQRPEFGETFGACGASATYRRDVFLAHNGFDERYFCYMEDVDLAFRMRLAGERCLFLPDAVVQHKGGGLSGEKSEFSTVHGARNRVWTYFANMPAELLILTLPGHLVLTAYLLLWYIGRPYGRYVWSGTVKGWAKAFALRRERKQIRRNRRVSIWNLAGQMAWNPFLMSRHAPHIRRIGPKSKNR